jgi:hypothetical protein
MELLIPDPWSKYLVNTFYLKLSSWPLPYDDLVITRSSCYILPGAAEAYYVAVD